MVWGPGSRVQGSRFRVQGLGFGVWRLGFEVYADDLGCEVEGSTSDSFTACEALVLGALAGASPPWFMGHSFGHHLFFGARF